MRRLAELDLTKAIQIGAEALADCDGSKYPLSYVEPMREALKDCLPHILDALAAKALAELDRKEWGSLANITAAKWLREKAQEARND
jgi:hypothetical protein